MDFFRLSSLIGILCNFGITAFLAISSARSKFTNILFAGFTFAAGLWHLGAYMYTGCARGDDGCALFWLQVAYTGAICAILFFYHFVTLYVNNRKPVLTACLYGTSAVIMFFNWFDASRLFLGSARFVDAFRFYWLDAIKHPNPVYFAFYFGYFWVILGYCFYMLVDAHNKSSGATKKRLKYFILAVGFGWIGTNPLFLPAFRIDVYPYTNLLVATYPFLVFYAIVRHQVMDIEVVIKKTLVFAGLLASVLAIVILPTLLINDHFFGNAGPGAKAVGLLISGTIIILTIRRIENFLVNITDRYLFQKKVSYKDLLKSFTSDVLTVPNLDELATSTVDELVTMMKIDSCALLLYDEEKECFFVKSSRNIKDASITLPRPGGRVTFMDETRGCLQVKEFKEKDVQVPDYIMDVIKGLSAELIIPLVLHETVIGMLALGKKKSDEDYTQDDIDILLPLVRTLAIAISNAELFDKLGKTQAEAAQKEKMAVIGTLSAGINHEICNPLGIARGQCEAFLLNLKDGLYDTKTPQELLVRASEIMGKVIKETDRATAITKKLSTFAKPAKGVHEYVNVEKEIDEVLGLVNYELSLDKIKVDKSIEPGLPLIVSDRKQFQEALFNLTRNAAQSIGEKGRVRISAREEYGKVLIDITDTGTGIPPEKIKQLFNPFFTTKDPGKGTGLGLFIVRQVVEKNGGRIYLKETRVGQGTTFTLEFPAGASHDDGGA